ncbi:MAG: DUF6270 domain-containing protein [archaeon]
MNKINIGVIGSCHTAAMFNSKFSNYKKYYDCKIFQHQTSIISLMTDPILVSENKYNNLEKNNKKQLKSELTKSFLSNITENKPDWLIIDLFVDAVIGLIKISNNQYLSYNKELLADTKLFDELRDKEFINIIENTNEYFALWKKNVNKLFNFIKVKLPECGVIINLSRLAKTYIDKKGNIKKIKDYTKEIKKGDEFLYKLNHYIINNYNVHVLNMTDKIYRSYEDHEWGESVVHYTPQYYKDALKKLNEICLK